MASRSRCRPDVRTLKHRPIRVAAADVLDVVDVDRLRFTGRQAADQLVADIGHVDRHVERHAPLDGNVPRVRAPARRFGTAVCIP